MATKEQERKALEKIRRIVTELGENSYVGMAFEGCFEIALDNINNDFGNDPMDLLRSAREEAESWKNKVADEQLKAKAINEAHLEEVNKLQETIERLTGQLASEKEYGDRKREEVGEATNTAMEYFDSLQATKQKLEEAEDTIIKLKAKLYDLMTA